MHRFRPTVIASLLFMSSSAVYAQAQENTKVLDVVTVEASADASAEGLSKPFAGGQVARGARTGILGSQDMMNTPFSVHSYTNELIVNQQAKSVGDVLLNDPSVRQARGFGNFQEVYVIRGFPVFSDDIGYNGLYGMLPRQYVAAEFFERVEVLRGANAFLNGAAPGGSGIGGGINLVPKRAGNDPLTMFTTGVQSGGQAFVAADVARRFGAEQSTGLRLNAVRRDGDTTIDDESRELSAFGLGLDWRSRDVRLSADLGYQDNRYDGGRPSVTPDATFIPKVPDNKNNYGQPWTYSNEEDVFATVRAEWDIRENITAWAAGGIRRSEESNSLSGVTVVNRAGDTTANRFDNEREDDVTTAEVGIRTKFNTGSVGHQVVASAATYAAEERNAFSFNFSGAVLSNLYSPFSSARPDNTTITGDLDDPARFNEVNTYSYALADTLSFADDRLMITLGVRHQTIEQKSYSNVTGVKQSDYNESATTPVAGIVLKATDNLSLYANYIEGLIKGEVAPATSGGQPVANAGEIFKPYRAEQTEVGLKWQGRNIGASMAVFSTDRPLAYVDANRVFDENGEQRNRGLELMVYGQPIKGVRVLGGATFIQAKMRDTAIPAEDDNYAVGVPKQQYNFGAEWDVRALPGLTFEARVVHTSNQYANAANTLKVGSWSRYDIGTRYVTDIANRLVTFRARIDNLFDEEYWASVGGFPGANYLVQSMPRTVSVSASIEF